MFGSRWICILYSTMLVKLKFRGVQHTPTWDDSFFSSMHLFPTFMKKTVYVYIIKCIYLYGIKVDENITVFIFPNIITILKKFALKP